MFVVILSVMGMALACGTTFSQLPPNPEIRESLNVTEIDSDYPTVKQIIENYIKALGGRETLKKHVNSHWKFKALSSFGSAASNESWQAPGRYFSRMTNKHGLESGRGVRTNGGLTKKGHRAGVAWRMPVGSRIDEYRDDRRQEAIRRRSSVAPCLHWLEEYKSIELVSLGTIDERPVYVLEFKDETNDSIRMSFDQESGLLLRRETREFVMLSMTSVTRDFLDYRKIEGEMVSFRQHVRWKRHEMTYEILDYEFNIEIPKKTFDIPKELSLDALKPWNPDGDPKDDQQSR